MTPLRWALVVVFSPVIVLAALVAYIVAVGVFLWGRVRELYPPPGPRDRFP